MNDKLLSLMHGETSDKKKQYNAEYYRAHKDYWKQYRETGQGIDSSTSGKSPGASATRPGPETNPHCPAVCRKSSPSCSW